LPRDRAALALRCLFSIIKLVKGHDCLPLLLNGSEFEPWLQIETSSWGSFRCQRAAWLGVVGKRLPSIAAQAPSDPPIWVFFSEIDPTSSDEAVAGW
jgi:hypothetical protein